MSASDRLAAALADRYRIERELGAGGMATVYLAADLKHDRKVAIKVLKPELAAVLGAERFVQEIKTTAALSHPHILPLFDSGEAGGFLYYVMPYLQGETIREKLNRETQFGIEEAVKIATEVAEALDYAHQHGVIHRDIKPENILLHAGRPMVMDFGIALAVSAAAGGRMTETGLSLGTPHYMSPEQATADKDITARSDIYSLASVLYEMLAGVPPHEGGSAQQTIMRIITETPKAVSELRRSVPPNVAAAVAKALEKLPADRFESAKAFAEALANRGFMTEAVTAAAFVPTSVRGWLRNPLSWGVGSVALAALLVASWAVSRPPAPAAVSTLAIHLEPGQDLSASRVFDISRDGSVLAYVGPAAEAGGEPRLWVRRVANLEPTPLAGTDGAISLSLSPDGSEVAFSGQTVGELKAMSLTGGPTRALGQSNPSSLLWGVDGYVYGRRRGEGVVRGVVRTPAGGGVSEPLAVISGADFVTDILPGGRFALLGSTQEGPEISLLDLATGEQRRLTEGSYARFLEPGYLVILAGDVIAGARFDGRELRGPVIPLVQNVERFRVSDAGTLVYATRDTAEAEFVWVDRTGNAVPAAAGWTVTGLAPRGFSLSADDRRLVFSATAFASSARAMDPAGTGSEEIWVKELPDGGLLRLTREGRQSWGPRWAGTGDRITYTQGTTGSRAVLSRRADGIGTADTILGGILDAPDAQLAPDSGWLVLRIGLDAGRYRQVIARRLGPNADSTIFVNDTAFHAVQPTLSPDGRLLAYASNESGQFEVYVRSFPDITVGRIAVSTNGGTQPKWSRSGQELFFVSAEGQMMGARIETTPLRVRDRQPLFTIAPDYLGLANTGATNYEVASDGKRFLLAREVQNRAASRGTNLIVVQNWIEELKRVLGR